MHAQNVNDLLQQSIREESLPYELKNEMWRNIDRKVGAVRMSKLKRPARRFYNTLAWLGTTLAIGLVVLFGGYLYLNRQANLNSAADQGVQNRTESNPTTDTSSLDQPNVAQNRGSTSPVHEQSYSSVSEATNEITSIEQGLGQFHSSGPAVSLGSGILAKFSGSAGLNAYTWNEGRWTILARFWGPGATGIQVAQGMAAYLHTHTLPVPQAAGVIVVTQTSSSGTPNMSQITIAWQVGTKVYELQQTGEPVKALETVVNSTHG